MKVDWSQTCGKCSLIASHGNAIDPSYWCLQDSIEGSDTGMAIPQDCHFGRRPRWEGFEYKRLRHLHLYLSG